MTLQEAAQHLAVEQELYVPMLDIELIAHITRLITAARVWAETETRRAFIGQDWRLTMPSFPGALADQTIALPLGRCLAVRNVQYRDTGGDWRTLTGATGDTIGNDYDEDLNSTTAGEIYPFTGESWPFTQDARNAVRVLGRFGYGDLGDVPADIKQAILLRLADMFEGRGPEDKKWTDAAKMVLAPYVIYAVPQ